MPSTLPAEVTGIDFLAEPITKAKKKAAERGLPTTFLVKDDLTPKGLVGALRQRDRQRTGRRRLIARRRCG